MPAHEKVSVQKIVAALTKWRGNVKASAGQLGISTQGLWQRLHAVGLDPSPFRKVDSRVSTFSSDTSKHQGAIREKGRNYFSRPGPGPIIRSQMSSEPVERFPGKRRQAPRITPDHLDRLSEARFDFMSILRREISEQEILEACLDECLGAWIERQAARLRQTAGSEALPAAKPKRQKRGEGSE